MAATLSITAKRARLDAITTAVGSAGKLVIYSNSSSKPTHPEGAAGTVLATLTLPSPFAPAATTVSGQEQLTIDCSSLSVNASASGTAGWARMFKSDGTTAVCDLSVGTAGTDIILNSTTLTSGVSISVTAFTIIEGN